MLRGCSRNKNNEAAALATDIDILLEMVTASRYRNVYDMPRVATRADGALTGERAIDAIDASGER